MKELEDEDEIILAQRDNFKYKSSTRSRPKKAVELPEANNVKDFVNARKDWIVAEEKVSPTSLCAKGTELDIIDQFLEQLSLKIERAFAQLRRAEQKALEEEKEKYREKLVE